MAWNSAKPAAGDQLADSQSDIKGNFQAIETGSSDFFNDKINLKERADTPTEITNRFQLYTKEIDSQSELFGRNDDSTEADSVVQITHAGNLGSTTTTLEMQDMTFDASNSAYLMGKNSMISCHGYINSSGTLITGRSRNVASASYGSNQYTITTDAVFGSDASIAKALVFAIPESTSDRWATVSSAPAGDGAGTMTFKVQVRNTSGSSFQTALHFMVIGGFD